MYVSKPHTENQTESAMPLTENEVLPIPHVKTDDEKRLWIGNLDLRITEFQLLKIVQKYGSIEKFDLMYHKSGPQAGQSRGFAFVTFVEQTSAQRMVNQLNGKRIGAKVVIVKLAHTVDKDFDKPKTEISIPALGPNTKRDKYKSSRKSQIHAIESKLKMMQELPSEDFQLSNEPSTSGCLNLLNLYNQSHQTRSQSCTTQRFHYKNLRNDSRHKPYARK